MDKLFPSLYAPPKKQEPQYGFADVLTSAFRLENDLVNLYDFATRDSFEPELDFDYERRWQENNLPLEWKPRLAATRSKMEFDTTLARIRQEETDKAVLASSGWLGTVSAMATGILSPTSLIPIVGQGSRGRLAVAEAFGLAAAGATASEAALMLNQETRSAAEVATSIGIGTMLGGLMGTGFVALSARAQKKLAREFPLRSEQMTLTRFDADLRAAEEVLPNPTARVADETVIYSLDEIVQPEFLTRIFTKADQQNAPAEMPEIEINAAQLRSAKDHVQIEFSPEAKAVEAQTWVNLNFPQEIAEAVSREEGGAEKFVQLLAKAYDDSSLKGLDDAWEARTAGAVDEVNEPYRYTGQRTIPETDTQGVSAQIVQTKYRNASSFKRPIGRVAKAVFDIGAKLNPLTRTALNRVSPRTRDNALRLGSAGLRQDNLGRMQPSASGGFMEQRIKAHDSQLVKLFSTLDDAYLLHVYGKAEFDEGKRSALVAQLRSQLIGAPPGKLTWAEFGQEVYDALTTGKTSVPEAMKGASALKEFFAYYNGVHKEYLVERQLLDPEAKPMYKELGEEDFEEGVVEYAHMIWDSAKIQANSAEFLREFAERAERLLQKEFAKAEKQHMARLAKDESDILFVQMTPEQQMERIAEIESEIDMLAETPEYSSFRDELKEIRKTAKDEGWSEDQLKSTLKDKNENAPKAYKEILKLRLAAQNTRRNLKALGGSAVGGLEDARAKQQALEASLYNTLGQVSDRVGGLKLDIINNADAMHKRLRKAEKTLGEALNELRKRNANLEKLVASARKNPVSRAKAEELLTKSQKKVEAMEASLAMAQGRALGDQQTLRELIRLRSDVLRETRDALRGRYARLEKAEDEVQKLEAKDLTPEEKAALVKEMEAAIEKRRYDFSARWQEKGAVWVNTDEGATPDFRDRALELASDFQQRLVGNGELRPAGISIIGAERGPQLRRMLKLPYEQKKKWLIRDPETVARAYDRQMAPDLELWREFGSVNGGRMFTELDEDIRQLQLILTTSTHVKLPKEWRLKARAFGEKVSRDGAAPDEGFDFFLGEDNFSSSAAEGFEPITEKLRAELNDFLSVQHRKLTRDLGVMVQRLRKQRMVPQDSSSFMWRTGRFIKDWNVMTMMGKVLPSSFGDVARPVMKYGILKVYGKAWKPMLASFRSSFDPKRTYRSANNEVNKRLGISVEVQLHSRASAVFDLAYDRASGLSLPERAARFGANKMGIVAMFDMWTDAMKNVSASVVHATMSEYIPEVTRALLARTDMARSASFEGELGEKLVYLRRLGLQDADIVRIGYQMQKPGGMEEFTQGAKLPNLDAWDDKAAFRAYSSAVQREVDDLIVTPGLDRPNWHDENLAYSMLAQFQSYTFTAHNRIVMSALQGNDPYLLQGFSLAIAMGALSYYTGAWVSGGNSWEKARNRDADGVLYEAIDKSGILGALSLVTRLGEQLPYTSELAIFGGEEQKYRRPSGLYGTIFGPTAGQLEKVADVLTNIDDEKQRERIMRRIWTLLPYNNVFYIQAAMARMRD